MNLVFTILLVLLAALGIWAIAQARQSARRSLLTPALNTLSAIFGSHVNSLTQLADAAIATRFLLGKRGTDINHAAVLTAASDEPIGVITDEATAAEDPINVELLALTNRTVPMVASGVVAIDASVYATATGKIQSKPTAAGTYWRVGKARQAATADADVIEVEPCKPRKLIVLAALTNTSGDIADTNSTAVNPTKADFDSLLTAAGKLQVDFLLLAAALNNDADVAYATT